MDFDKRLLGEEDLLSFSKSFIELLRIQLTDKRHIVVLMTGEMGAGKTTFLRKTLSLVSQNQTINSPTYTLQNIYETELGEIHHFDLYRLKSVEEVSDLGFEEVWSKAGISFVEWWEKGGSLIKSRADVELRIETLPGLENKRQYVLL